MILLKNLQCYTPSPVGIRDILIAGRMICTIALPGHISLALDGLQTVDCSGLHAFPGMLDQHVHLIGGGGEGGPRSAVPELAYQDIIQAGVTTVVGVLGMDCYARNLRQLHAKAKALEIQGLTAFLYTGSYAVPAPTLTGSVTDDLILVDGVIGTGEVAISDHRSSVASVDELVKLAAQTHAGAMLGSKAGVVHFHVGDGRQGLDPLLDLLARTDLPMDMFVPTHINRSEQLFREGIKYLKSGGRIDLTAGETNGIAVHDALARLQKMNLNLAKVTVSSDANGSIPGGGISPIQALFDDIRSCIFLDGMAPEVAFRFVTENVAQCLKLYPAKGALLESSDADILITDSQYNLIKLFCKGSMVLNQEIAAGNRP